jgi:epsilon-lactone hydrolase
MTPEEEYLAWQADRAAKNAALPSPLTVTYARGVAVSWAAENDDRSKLKTRRRARVTPSLALEWSPTNRAALGQTPLGYVLHIRGAVQNGSPASYRPLAAQIAAAIPATVAVLEYRRPPEHRFPAVVDDVAAALSWFVTTRKPMRRLILSADSFGAMPALSAVMRRRAAGMSMPAGIYLLCPDADYTNRGFLAERPYDPNPDTCVLTDALNQYFPPERPHTDPEASPGLQDLTGLPPILMHESRNAPLAHALDLRDALIAADADFQFQDWDYTPHIFPAYGATFSATAEAMSSLRAWARPLLSR